MSPTEDDLRASSAERFLRLVQAKRRGTLKVYLGLAAGVGKTYRRLQEAHDLHQHGVHVLLGYVETHGRAGTGAGAARRVASQTGRGTAGGSGRFVPVQTPHRGKNRAGAGRLFSVPAWRCGSPPAACFAQASPINPSGLLAAPFVTVLPAEAGP